MKKTFNPNVYAGMNPDEIKTEKAARALRMHEPLPRPDDRITKRHAYKRRIEKTLVKGPDLENLDPHDSKCSACKTEIATVYIGFKFCNHCYPKAKKLIQEYEDALQRLSKKILQLP